MNNLPLTDIHVAVRDRYTELATSQTDTCCAPEGECCGNELYQIDLSELPQEATSLSLGCGDPITLASLQSGQTVLDLGSGAGMDCFLAAQRVGDSGQVIGVDMTPAMLDKANANKAKLGLTNVDFRYGQIEQMPVDSATIDVVISNCVINLAPDKHAVFAEIFRVLKPGGRVAVSDMVTLGTFSAAQRADQQAWSACVTGAEEVGKLVESMSQLGFKEISIRDRGDLETELRDMIVPADRPARLLSAQITARKPAA